MDAADRAAELDEKDQIYAALVRAVQARAPGTRVASAFAWCGLWPSLDRIYRRRMRYFGDDPDELTQVIWLSFTELVNRIDVARATRIAATLTRGTDRDVRKALRRARGEVANPRPEQQRAAALYAKREVTVTTETTDVPQVSELAASAASFSRELAELRAEFVPLLGSDADLLLAVLVLGMDQRSAAARMGLTYAAARQRLHRAVLRIRAHLRPTGRSDAAPQSFGALVNSSVADPDDEME